MGNSPLIVFELSINREKMLYYFTPTFSDKHDTRLIEQQQERKSTTIDELFSVKEAN
jgi:hypothetical protein